MGRDTQKDAPRAVACEGRAAEGAISLPGLTVVYVDLNKEYPLKESRISIRHDHIVLPNSLYEDFIIYAILVR